ncbi:MAG TPA: hypothetical protein V6C89_03270 [Drouetiella sp.]|jgi:hypothetical protein
MTLNKCHYDFHLLSEGWLSVPPYDEGAEHPEAPAETAATIRMTEFNKDDKPDIWYHAEVVTVSTNQSEVSRLIEKYGLPNAIRVNCIAQQADLRERLLNRSN